MTDIRVSEWDGTPWAGSTVVRPHRTLKAVYGGPALNAYQNDVPLSSWSDDPLNRAAAYLRAYKVGWFYKAESRISTDIANLKRTLAPEDDEGDNESDILEADLTTPWEGLDPAHQFLRLMERPNPRQTGRQLFQKTQIRLDMAGWTFWYLEGAGPIGSGVLPTAIYGISPTRMTPSFDKAGNLIGWVMDADARGGGVPFEAYEIVQFASETADDSAYGQGVVEAVMAELPIGGALSRHQVDMLSTGGRLAGMLWPKERTLDEDEFVDAQRAWRNVASDPNAARRMLLFPEPMEYSNGASNPAEIGIPDLSLLNRDNILTAFPISPYMLGVPTPGGLNSGEVRREDRRDYWEGTIHPRVELLEEVIQTQVVARYETVIGSTLDFDIEEPNLENAASLIEKVAAFEGLTTAGFDADDAIELLGLDVMKWTKPAPPPPPVVATVVTSDQTPHNGSNVNMPVPQMPNMPAKSVESDRDDVTDKATRNAQDRLTRFFAEQRQRVVTNLKESLPLAKAAREAYVTGSPYFDLIKARPANPYRNIKETRNLSRFGRDVNDHEPIDSNPLLPIRVKAEPTWWDPEFEDKELTATMRAIYAEVGRGALQTVADAVGRFIYAGATNAVIADLLSVGGERIADINARTLQAITVELAEGTRRGYSIPQLIDGVPDEGYRGINGAGLDNGVEVWSDNRAETIARTETTLSYNRATVTGYGEFGVRYLLAYDGDGDPECAARNGIEYTIDEAQGIEDHPNGTLVWSPVIDKAVKELEPAPFAPVVNVTVQMPDTYLKAEMPTPVVTVNNEVPVPLVTVHNEAAAAPSVTVTNDVQTPSVTVQSADVVVNVPQGAAPVVNVTPDIHVDPSIITVKAAAPVVNVQVPDTQNVNVSMPETLTIASMPDRVTRRTVKRNKQNLITETSEFETDG